MYGVEGVMTVSTSEGTWVVPPHRAVWLPNGVTADVRMTGAVTVRSLFFRSVELVPCQCFALSVSPLLRELITHIALTGPMFRSNPHHQRLTELVLDFVRTADSLPVHLPVPRETVFEALSDPLADPRSVALDHGYSLRTLERRIKNSTGMSLGVWRHQARLLKSLELLAAGESVGEVAFLVGYEGASSFIHAFRRAFGTSPGAYFKLDPPTRSNVPG